MAKQEITSVGAAQFLTGMDVDENAVKIRHFIHEASSLGCRILLFHEGCLTGYPDKEQIKDLDIRKISAYEQEFIRLAGESDISLLLGSTSARDGSFYNDVVVIGHEGRLLGRYAKTWRAGEPWYGAGSGPVIFSVSGLEATVIICHDLRYPEMVRLPVAAGARIVFIANNESGLLSEHKLLGYLSMQISRATENHVFAVMANAPSDAMAVGSTNCSHGNSKIIDPMGNVIDEAGWFEERLVWASLDMTQATGQPALRSMGHSPEIPDTYGTDCEHPDYSSWIKSGLRLVNRLDGAEP